MTQQKSLNNYKSSKNRLNMGNSIQIVKSGFGKYQKGEGEIACTYANANLAVKAMLKSLGK